MATTRPSVWAVALLAIMPATGPLQPVTTVPRGAKSTFELATRDAARALVVPAPEDIGTEKDVLTLKTTDDNPGLSSYF